MERKEHNIMDKSLESYALSIDEMNNLMGGRASILTYPDLDNFNNIDEVLGGCGMAILLYLVDENKGHYACIFRRSKNILEFFDSYGIYPDDELDFNSDAHNNSLDQELPFLKRLIKKSNYDKIIWNEIPVQRRVAEIATCGRHCAFRLFKKKLTHDKFIRLYEKARDRGFTNDSFVTMLTNGLF